MINTGASKKLKIAFFSEDFSRQAKGTALVVQQLAEQFTSNFSDKVELTLIRKEGFCRHPLANRIRNIEIKVYPTPIFSTLISYLIFFLKNKEEFDAVIFNRNVYPGFWLLKAKKFVLLLYDAPANPIYKVKMSLDIKLIDIFLKYIGKYFLDAVIAVSKSAKEDIIWHYRIDPDKIFSIYCGVSDIFRPLTHIEKEKRRRYLKEKYKITAPYILDVSRLDPHKNIEVLIDAFSILKKEHKIPHKLVIVGGRHLPEYSAMIEKKIKESVFGKEILIASYIEDEDLPAVYNLADILAFPSLLEGFGLPLVEAMKCGVPIVASNTQVMREITNGAAELVNPRDAKQLAGKIFEVLENQKMRNELIAAGLERSKIFSWRKTAEEILKILCA